MKIKHRRGTLHGNTDGLSRIPCKQCGMNTVKGDKDTTILVHKMSTQDKNKEDKDINPYRKKILT